MPWGEVQGLIIGLVGFPFISPLYIYICWFLFFFFFLGKQKKMYVPEREEKITHPFEMCYYLLISLIRLHSATQGVYSSLALPSDHLSWLTFSLINVFLA